MDDGPLHLPGGWESGRHRSSSVWPSTLPWTASESLPATQAGDEHSVQEYYDPPLWLTAICFAQHHPVHLDTCLHSCSHHCTLGEPWKCKEIPFLAFWSNCALCQTSKHLCQECKVTKMAAVLCSIIGFTFKVTPSVERWVASIFVWAHSSLCSSTHLNCHPDPWIHFSFWSYGALEFGSVEHSSTTTEEFVGE